MFDDPEIVTITAPTRDTSPEANRPGGAVDPATELRRLAVELPKDLDDRLKSLINDKWLQSGSGDTELRELTAHIARGNYDRAGLDRLVAFMDARSNGSGRRAQAAVWLAGLPCIRAEHRTELTRTIARIVTSEQHDLWGPARPRVFAAIRWAMLASLVPASILSLNGGFGNLSALFQVLMICWAICFIPMLGLAMLGSRGSTSQQARDLQFLAVLTLGRLGQKEAIGPLLIATGDLDASTSDMAVNALRPLLTLLSDSDYGTMASNVVPGLVRLLGRPPSLMKPPARYSGDFTLEVLNALRKVGDARAMPQVERMCTRGQDEVVRECARSVYAVLEWRRALDAERVTLVRGSSEPPATADTLLRAAGPSTQQTGSEQLLRASEPEQRIGD